MQSWLTQLVLGGIAGAADVLFGVPGGCRCARCGHLVAPGDAVTFDACCGMTVCRSCLPYYAARRFDGTCQVECACGASYTGQPFVR